MFSFFGKRTKCIECCYCAKMMRVYEDAEKCECGEHENPPFYMQDYAIAKPFHMPVVGWTSVGKTVWVKSVTRRLRELSASVWKDFVIAPGNEETMFFFRDVEEARERQVPASTLEGVPTAYVILLKQMPLWGNRTFVMRDVSGESFKDFVVKEEQVSFLQNTRSAFFMFSLADLKRRDRAYESMEQLLYGYVNTLIRQHVNVRRERRKIVVILSKADLLQKEVPGHLLNYLRTDPIAQSISSPGLRTEMNSAVMADYLKAMTCVSDEIAAWVASRPDGKNFISFARDHNIDLRFSLVSCLDGQTEDDGAMGNFWEPYRVLDPLFWGFEFHSAKA